jgi:ribosomal protein S18 acetylase RimI-like enzyme
VASDPTVRSATLADVRQIARVHIESWRIGYRGLLEEQLLAGLSIAEREAMWRKRLSGEEKYERRVDVAVNRGETIVGFVVAGPSEEQAASERIGEIYALYVLPDHWSMGVGQALMDAAVDHLAGTGSSRALLWVLASNTRARRFYERSDWTWDGRTKTKLLTGLPDFDSEVEEVCYWRHLKRAHASMADSSLPQQGGRPSHAA